MAALSLRELTLLRLVFQMGRAHIRETDTMHEKVAALHAQFDTFEAAVAAAKARETSLVDTTQRQAEDLAVAKANALDADTLDALDAINARLAAATATLDGPTA